MGIAFPNDYIKKALVASNVLNIGQLNAWINYYPFNLLYLDTRGFYAGVIDGSTEFGDVIGAGSVDYFENPPKVAPDSKRRSLAMRQWMNEFLKSTSNPSGHGFTKEMVKKGFACYSFHPKAGVPIKVIAFDNTNKIGMGDCSIDLERFNWLVSELDAGEAAGELMIINSHIPINPYQSPGVTNPAAEFSDYSDISAPEFFNKLWSYKNIILWNAGHVHRNTITNQTPWPYSPYYNETDTERAERSFWEVETPSLRDFPRQFRRFDIYRTSDNNISIYAIDVDPAVNPAVLTTGGQSPAWKARRYAIGAQQIFHSTLAWSGLHVDQHTAVYNANLVKRLTPAMQTKLSRVNP
jgi:hypothetical protein